MCVLPVQKRSHGQIDEPSSALVVLAEIKATSLERRRALEAGKEARREEGREGGKGGAKLAATSPLFN